MWTIGREKQSIFSESIILNLLEGRGTCWLPFRFTFCGDPHLLAFDSLQSKFVIPLWQFFSCQYNTKGQNVKKFHNRPPIANMSARHNLPNLGMKSEGQFA